jgi:hypothetical protein
VLSTLAAAAAETGSVTAAPGREVAAVAAMAPAERLAYPLQTLYRMVAATVSQGPGFLAALQQSERSEVLGWQ